jgi:hypothetical protein
VPPFLDRPLRTGKPFAKRPRAAYAGGGITRPTGRSRSVRASSALCRPERGLGQAALQGLMHLAEALAAELDVTFGDDP